MRLLVIAAFVLSLANILPATRAEADTLDAIRSRGAILIGYREGAPPFSQMGKNGQPEGYSIDLCNRIAQDVKSALSRPDLAIKYVPVTADNRIERLIGGDIDIECGSTTRTLSRQAQVDFTLFTFLTGTEILVPATSSIHGPRDLAGKSIAVQTNTTTEAALKQLLGLLLIGDTTFVSVPSSEQGMSLLLSGKVDGYASDAVVLAGLATSAASPRNLRLSGSYYSYEPYALMVRKNDSAFRLIADRALAALFNGGSRGEIAAIYSRWFGQFSPDPPQALQQLYAIESLAP